MTIIIKRYITSETDRDLVAYLDDKEIARISYSISLNRTKGIFDAETEIEEAVVEKFPQHLIEFDY